MDEEIGEELPDELVQHVATELAAMAEQIGKKNDAFARETDMTGYLAGLWDGYVHEADGWEIRVKAVTYSPEVKEPKTGADMGIIFDLSRAGIRILKAMWFQAKRPSAIRSPSFRRG